MVPKVCDKSFFRNIFFSRNTSHGPFLIAPRCNHVSLHVSCHEKPSVQKLFLSLPFAPFFPPNYTPLQIDKS